VYAYIRSGNTLVSNTSVIIIISHLCFFFTTIYFNLWVFNIHYKITQNILKRRKSMKGICSPKKDNAYDENKESLASDVCVFF